MLDKYIPHIRDSNLQQEIRIASSSRSGRPQ